MIKCAVKHRCKTKWKWAKCSRCTRNKGFVLHSEEYAMWMFRDFYTR